MSEAMAIIRVIASRVSFEPFGNGRGLVDDLVPAVRDDLD